MRIDLKRRRLLAAGLAVGSLALLAGCAGEPSSRPEIPEIRFLSTPPISLRVPQIAIVDEAPPDPPGPAWANVFPTMPRAAMRNWASDRLAADPSATGSAAFRITEASVEYKAGEPVKGLFAPERRESFLIRVAADLEVRRADGSLEKTAVGKAWGQESFPVDQEPYARRLALDALVRRVMADFDREMEQAIRANMADLTR